MSRASRAEIQRFNKNTAFGNGDERCLLWKGRTDPAGYGRFDLDSGRSIAVHRFVLEHIMDTPIPEGLQGGHVCHDRAVLAGTCDGGDDCRHRLCCNPEHLELQTPSENTTAQKHYERGKTHCPKGHPYDEENTAHRGGKRFCRQCDRDRKKK